MSHSYHIIKKSHSSISIFRLVQWPLQNEIVFEEKAILSWFRDFLHFLAASRLLEHLFYGPGDTMKFFFEIKVFKNFIVVLDETLVAQESNIMTKFLSEIPKIHENP